MDSGPEFEPKLPKRQLLEDILGSVATAANFVWQQLSTADLNPHEGRLRASVMPEHYMHIPDFPPVIDEPPTPSL